MFGNQTGIDLQAALTKMDLKICPRDKDRHKKQRKTEVICGL
jgi:hypothetical protein